jgi:hypothetical protein
MGHDLLVVVVLEGGDLLIVAPAVSGHEEAVDRGMFLTMALGILAGSRVEVREKDCVEQWDKGPQNSTKVRGRRSCASRRLDQRIVCRCFE